MSGAVGFLPPPGETLIEFPDIKGEKGTRRNIIPYPWISRHAVKYDGFWAKMATKDSSKHAYKLQGTSIYIYWHSYLAKEQGKQEVVLFEQFFCNVFRSFLATF